MAVKSDALKPMTIIPDLLLIEMVTVRKKLRVFLLGDFLKYVSRFEGLPLWLKPTSFMVLI